MTSSPGSDNVESVRAEIEDLKRNQEQILVMVGGDPMVADEKDIRHPQNSLVGREAAASRSREHLANAIDEIRRLVVELELRMESLVQELEDSKFGWDTVVEWLRRDGHWWKVASLAGFGVLYAESQGWLPF